MSEGFGVFGLPRGIVAGMDGLTDLMRNTANVRHHKRLKLNVVIYLLTVSVRREAKGNWLRDAVMASGLLVGDDHFDRLIDDLRFL